MISWERASLFIHACVFLNIWKFKGNIHPHTQNVYVQGLINILTTKRNVIGKTLHLQLKSLGSNYLIACVRVCCVCLLRKKKLINIFVGDRINVTANIEISGRLELQRSWLIELRYGTTFNFCGVKCGLYKKYIMS